MEFIRASSVYTILHRDAVAFDLSVLEAMACGVPVLQPALGANPEIFTLAAGGILFDSNDALPETLIDLFAVPTRLPALAQHGREQVASQFTVARMAQETLAAYEAFR